MRKATMALLLIVSVTHPVFGEGNKDDSLFRPIKNRDGEQMFQVVAGLTDVALAGMLFKSAGNTPVIDSQMVALNSAQAQLQSANKLFSQSDFTQMKAQLEEAMDRLSDTDELFDLQDEYSRLMKTKTVPDDFKTKAIEKASAEVSNARAALLTRATRIKGNALGNTVRTLKVIGGTLFILDAGGRYYVWSALDQSPGFFPAGHVAYSAVKQAFEATPGAVRSVRRAFTEPVHSAQPFDYSEALNQPSSAKRPVLEP